MKRLILVVTVLFVLSFVVGALAQPIGAGKASRGKSFNAAGPRGRGMAKGAEKGPAGQGAGRRARPRPPAHRLGMMLVIAAQQDDEEIQELVDEAIADRKKMIELEGDRVKAFEDLIEGIRDGKTREELEDELDAVKEATEKLHEAGRELADDLKAIRDRLEELGVKAPNEGSGGAGPGKMGPRGARPGDAEDRGIGPRGVGPRGKGLGGPGAFDEKDHQDRPRRQGPGNRGGEEDDDFFPPLD